ncbi:MAG: acyl-CoA/acyl-ACP dehydrogenase [Beijerinckiaceae bacterium]|nr:acyl-CoA/acyl-ACP dehydrogenase [Beijerinckiaceae bacterium]
MDAEPTERFRLSKADLEGIASNAARLDKDGAFPADDIALLHERGLLLAALPDRGLRRGGHRHLKAILTDLGAANLSLGRLFEGHVNAARLIDRYAGDDLRARVSRDVASGHLMGIWNTEAIGRPLKLIEDGESLRLEGGKTFVSGVGHIDRAVVSAIDGQDVDRLIYAEIPRHDEGRIMSGWGATAMRATANGGIDLTGIRIEPMQVFGNPGDYMREPDFSAGAWRTLAVQLGGMNAIAAALIDHLVNVAQGTADLQRMRLGTIIARCQTASLWVDRCACVAETDSLPVDEIVATVNLGRSVVSEAARDVIDLTKQAIGARAFLVEHPAERLLRDLDFYLRQPAPDQAVLKAASFFIENRMGNERPSLR